MFRTPAGVLQCPYLGLLPPTEAGMRCVTGVAAAKEELANTDDADANNVVTFA